MSWTKRDIIKQAFVELGLASYTHDLSADELQDGLRILDSMMGEWTTKGIVFDPIYPNATTVGADDLDDLTNAPAEANSAMYYNLAIRLAPGFGKAPSNETILNAKAGFSLLAQAIPVPEIQMTGMMRGSGAKNTINPFIGGKATT